MAFKKNIHLVRLYFYKRMNLGRKKVALKSTVDEALASCPQVQTVFVSKRTGADIKIHPRYRVFFLFTCISKLNIIFQCVGSARIRICIQHFISARIRIQVLPSQKVEFLTFFLLFLSNSYIF